MNERLFKRFIDRGAFEFEIYSDADKIKLWICSPVNGTGTFYEVTTFLDIARSLKKYADMYLEDDEEE